MQVPKQRWCVPALAVTLLFLIRSVQRLAVKSSSTLLLRSGNLAHASMPRLLRRCPLPFCISTPLVRRLHPFPRAAASFPHLFAWCMKPAAARSWVG